MSFASNVNAGAFVMNTPTASDFVVNNGLLEVSGLTEVLPKYTTFRLLTEGDAGGVRGLERSRIAQNRVYSGVFSATASTTYEIAVSGTNTLTGLAESRSVSYTTGTSATLAEIAGAIVSGLNSLPFNLTATGTTSPIAVTSPDPNLTITLKSGFTSFNLNQPTYAPNGTPAVAIRSTVAPSGTPATAVAGTTTVTVTTDAAHGLLPGDVVDISGATTFQFLDLRPGSSQAAAGAVTDVIIATVPTATTFTLQGVQGNGGTNGGTLTIRTKNVVTVETLAAHGLSAGNEVTVSGIATMTVNGGSSFTSIVRSVPATDELVLFGVANASNNSGTITITGNAQARANYGSDISLLFGQTPLNTWQGNSHPRQVNFGDTPDAADGYTVLGIEFGDRVVDATGGIQRNQTNQIYLYLNETAAGYGESIKRLGEIIRDYTPGTTLANPQSVAP